MDVYPKDVDSFPMFYTEEEKKMLEGTPMVEHIVSEIEEIKEEYGAIVNAVPEFKMFSFEEYMKNKTLVISRIFFVRIHGIEDRIIVPLADMFNHHYYEKEGKTYWKYDDKDDSFVVHAQKAISTGDPVSISFHILDLRKLWPKA